MRWADPFLEQDGAVVMDNVFAFVAEGAQRTTGATTACAATDRPSSVLIIPNCGSDTITKFFYPNATSNVIMMAKPAITPMVAKSTLPSRCDSGISSSVATKIIAPAAKASA